MRVKASRVLLNDCHKDFKNLSVDSPVPTNKKSPKIEPDRSSPSPSPSPTKAKAKSPSPKKASASPEKAKTHAISDDEEEGNESEDLLGKVLFKNGKFKMLELRFFCTAGTSSPPAATSSAPSTTPTTSSKRPKCPFGSKCYRKNPQHKTDQSHPGDSDYEEEVDY